MIIHYDGNTLVTGFTDRQSITLTLASDRQALWGAIGVPTTTLYGYPNVQLNEIYYGSAPRPYV